MRWTSYLVFALLGCSAGDASDGTRGQCAEGGALTACPESERTAEGACWRLVDCAAIPLNSNQNNVFDWGNCVNGIERLTADRERLVIDCVASSSCDQLKVDGSPQQPDTTQMYCLRFGGL
jgi:hypothetical protein